MDDQNKSLKLMRFWIFGTFLIIFVAATIYLGFFFGVAVFTELRYWLAILITAALSAGWYFLYKWYLERK